MMDQRPLPLRKQLAAAASPAPRAVAVRVSRPFLISLLERRDIDYTSVGRHRRIKADNLFAYKCARDEKRSKALADLAELDGENL